jgi:nitrous oxidase accessory protein NosD
MTRIIAAVLALLLAAAGPATAATLRVGSGAPYRLPSQAIAAAQPGDTVAIAPGTYADCAIVRQDRLTIIGTGSGAVLTGDACAGKALLVIDGGNDTIGNLTLRGAKVPDGNGAGIRLEGGSLTVVGVRFIDDQNGILTAPHPGAILRVRDSSFIGDGTCVSSAGCAHAIYANAMAELEVSHSRFYAIREGHNIKSRAALTVVHDCTIQDGPVGTSSYQIDLPNGGNLIAEGNLMQKGPHSGNHGTAISIGEEGLTQPTTTLVVRDNTLIDDTGHPTVFVRSLAGTQVRLAGNVFHGGRIIPLVAPYRPLPPSSLWHALLAPHVLAALAALVVVGGFAAAWLRRRRAVLGRPLAWRRLITRRALASAALMLVLAGGGAAVAAAIVLQRAGEPPRVWAPYVERRAAGHNPLIERVAAVLATGLQWLGTVRYAGPAALPHWIGATPQHDDALPAGPVTRVASVGALAAALQQAVPGEMIELLPGTYRLEGRGFYLDRPGRRGAPITLRAARLGEAIIDSDVVEAIKVAAPWWRFENLEIRGVCSDDSGCEHAFHIVGHAHDTVIRNSLLMNFNAQVKINTEEGANPDHGLIAGDTLVDTHPRNTPNPVTPVDLDTASGWRVTHTLIADFVKAQGNDVSYGAFAKADGGHNMFDHDAVLCQFALHGYPGTRVGLSFGGGGSPNSIRRDQGRSGLESIGGVMRDNLIAFCSDDGIYINRAAGSVITHNTLLDTGGIDVRYPQSSAWVADNIVDGAIRSRNGGHLAARGNRAVWLPALFLGLHPARGLYRDLATLDLRWRNPPSAGDDPTSGTDLCGAPWPAQPRPGAFQDFSACVARAGATPALRTGGAVPPPAAR